ncbi:MAG: hypothetical protein ACF8Q5_11180 [Phycisphaerales bacterium JB040]
MNPRFVTKDIHALLDYPVALVLMFAPFALGLGESHPLALWLGVATGVAALILTVLTDHKLGLVRVLPYRFHLVADAGVGLLFLAAPLALSFSGLDLWFYLANGAAVMTVVSLHKPEPSRQPHPA